MTARNNNYAGYRPYDRRRSPAGFRVMSLYTWTMTVGRYRGFFWIGAALVAVSLLAPWLAAWAVLPALVGLALHEHAYVQAGQSVPLS